MENQENNLDLLDLDDGTSMDTLPDATPFATPRPRRPWLLLGIGIVVIILATYIIIRTIGGDSSSSVDIDLDAPVVTVGGDAPGDADVAPTPNPDAALVVPAAPVMVAPGAVPPPAPQPQQLNAPAPQPVVQPVAQPQPQPQQLAGSPVRVIEDRKDVAFDPNKRVESAPAPKPAPKPVAQKPKPKPVANNNGSVAKKAAFYVQFGSYTTRSGAEAAQRKMQSSHAGLFSGHQFVILAAQLANGTTTYRLRVPFNTSADANSFCRNAKSDGLDCYVAK